MNKNELVCPECYENTALTEVTFGESVKIKNDTFKNTHHYMKCANCGKLFEVSNDIDLNYLSDYQMFRERNNLLQPKEVIEI